MAVPDITPPGTYDQSALVVPYAVVAETAPTPEAKEAVLLPGCLPNMKWRASKTGSGTPEVPSCGGHEGIQEFDCREKDSSGKSIAS